MAHPIQEDTSSYLLKSDVCENWTKVKRSKKKKQMKMHQRNEEKVEPQTSNSIKLDVTSKKKENSSAVADEM